MRWLILLVVPLVLVACESEEAGRPLSVGNTVAPPATRAVIPTAIIATPISGVRPAAPTAAASGPCPFDTSADLDRFATNASNEIRNRSGKTIAPSKIRSDVLGTVSQVWGSYSKSCSDAFAGYVIAES